MRENFDKLTNWKAWVDPKSSSSPQKFTIHRQRQLANILKKYDGKKIPFTHFTDEIVEDSAKRNKYVFPVIFAYVCGVLKVEGDFLVKPEGLILGERDISRNENHWM